MTLNLVRTDRAQDIIEAPEVSGIGNVEWCNVLPFLLIVSTKAQRGRSASK